MRFELPLFPLKTVLFPDMLLPLHIFEERYKQLIQTCLDKRESFGIVLLREDEDVEKGLEEPYAVGCTAQITQVQKLEEGRMLIVVLGEERFRIVSLNRDGPYLVGLVEQAPLQDEGPVSGLAAGIEHLYPMVIDYLKILARVSELELDLSKLPTHPHSFLYLAASIISAPMEQKQLFLATDKATHLLTSLQVAYRQEIALLRTLPTENMGPFSIN